MREINLISIIDSYKNLNSDLFQNYLKYYSTKLKDSEIQDLSKLVVAIKTISQKITNFDMFFVGYIIPQISKEFDLLRFDKDIILNIEIKRESTTEKLKKQLEQNKYYLSFLNREIHCFSYVSSENKVYSIDANNQIFESNIKQLLTVIASQNPEKISNIDTLFNPSNYLVSPFNSTNQFIKGRYFLTTHQENIKKEILKEINEPRVSIMSVKGKAGTGKTLLVYDIAKEIFSNDNVLVIHCGQLNEGHIQLLEHYKWDIVSAKYIFAQDFSKYKLVIVDEAQRVYPNYFDKVIDEVKANKSNCILSHDEEQTLSKNEINYKIVEKIEDVITVPTFELTNKIRTNKEVSNFTDCLFNKDKEFTKREHPNIEITYLQNLDETLDLLTHLQKNGWKIINYTPDGYKTPPYERFRLVQETTNSHRVIGQEFDNVVAVIDEHFYYKNSILSTKGYLKKPYYHPTKMLYQIISRTRLKLHLIIFRNEEILSRCLELIK
ncbi:DNA/RNA helicase domain-containing protein [Chryseobacterium sp. RRHN12]|uniref:DNA/RNA helicase domain-containing protein n=1 Tax=Chryseobacterium sp. RRHN12 TaxID=3437884 RepID=UPI003D9AFC7E